MISAAERDRLRALCHEKAHTPMTSPAYRTVVAELADAVAPLLDDLEELASF